MRLRLARFLTLYLSTRTQYLGHAPFFTRAELRVRRRSLRPIERREYGKRDPRVSTAPYDGPGDFSRPLRVIGLRLSLPCDRLSRDTRRHCDGALRHGVLKRFPPPLVKMRSRPLRDTDSSLHVRPDLLSPRDGAAHAAPRQRQVCAARSGLVFGYGRNTVTVNRGR